MTSVQPLPSWNDGPAKAAILDFVARVTAEGGPDYVPQADRVAVIDNDGTLWCERPAYVQAMFILGRLHEQAEAIPSSRAGRSCKRCWRATWARPMRRARRSWPTSCSPPTPG
ncbi:MAG: hypothetical protein ABW167_17515 [Baekduia sp.]